MTDSKLNHGKNKAGSLTAEYLIGPFRSNFTFTQKMLYTNPVVTTNQKPVMDVQKIKRQEFKYSLEKANKPWEKKAKEERNREEL